MCGICGEINPQGVSRAVIQQMTDILSHRGPEDDGIYLDEMAGLGHRRLSIIDLDGGHQPISNEDGTLWIILNGEIYNYRDVRASLRDTHQFSTNSDTEVILSLYEEKGQRCVEDLRGMFAFVIWDSREQVLFLARDHLGQKPMFYSHQGDRFAFASEIKALLVAHPELRQMDHEALHQYLSLRIITPPRTMFAPIRKLPPGHTLTFKEGQVTIERYWHLRYEPKHTWNEADLLDELESRMLEAVRFNMVSDVPVGAFLSGGLDSNLVVSMMSKVAETPVKTFSVGVPYEDFSELPAARITAQRCQTEHFEETIYPSLVRILPDLVWHLDEPSDPLSVLSYYIARMARREVKVVLGGDGGDELFGGYDRYYGQRFVNYYATLLPAPVRRHFISQILRFLPDGFWYKSFSHKLKWMNQLSLSPRGGQRYAQSLNYFYFSDQYRETLYGDRLTHRLNGYDALETIYAWFDCDNAEDFVDKMLFADSMVRLPDHPVMILDRMTMAHGLEARAPFMDHKLAEFAARIPASLKVKGRTLRYIQHRLAERYLAPELLKRKKQGFSSALPYLLADEFQYLFDEFLSDSHLVREGYLADEPIQKLLLEHRNRKVDHGNRLWLLCNAEIWYRMAIEEEPRETMKAQLMQYAGTAESPSMEPERL